jgi:hypothetical protein
MRLTELAPKFMRLVPDRPGVSEYVSTIQEAQGVMFLCPACFREAEGDPLKNRISLLPGHGVHSIRCWSESRGVPADVLPGPGRWSLEGTGFDDLTLGSDGGRSTSILLQTSACHAHFYVRNGEVIPA